MATLLTTLLFLSLLPLTTSTQTTHRALVFTLAGESTPHLTTTHLTLTPLGAHQALHAGAAIRARYLAPEENPDYANITAHHPIRGLHPTRLDNTQLRILASPEHPVSASALAFMQGLYPPVGAASGWPLGGYQYPRLATLSSSDPSHIYLAGASHCPAHALASAAYLSSPAHAALAASTAPFYASLPPSLFPSAVPESHVTFANALPLYRHAAFHARHNASSPAAALPAADLAMLRHLASAREWALHGNVSGSEARGGAGRIEAVAGATLAARVLASLSPAAAATRSSSSSSPRLELLFGSHEPFVAFAALSGLARHDAGFRGLPRAGSVMVFEVFSYSSESQDERRQGIEHGQQSEQEQRIEPRKGRWRWKGRRKGKGSGSGKGKGKAPATFVRFLFRNGTAAHSALVAYPLFGQPRGGVVRWETFEWLLRGAGVRGGVAGWCDVCGAGAGGGFCQGSGDGRKEGGCGGMRAPAAGALGAGVALLVVVVLVGAAWWWGRRGRGTEQSRVGRGLGGWRGGERLGSEVDLGEMGGKGGVVCGGEEGGRGRARERSLSVYSRAEDADGDGDIGAGRAGSEAVGVAERV